MSTRTVQWDAGGFAQLATLGQLDAHRPAELVLARSFGTIRALDVDLQLEKWSFDNFNTSALRLADLDGDGLDEVLVGDQQFGGITIHDGLTLEEEGFLPNLDSGVTDIQVADVDEDGGLEIVWGSGSSSTGTDEFFVSDAATLALEWRAPTLGGPMVGPGYGDVDGDGTKELVVAGTRGRFDFIGGPQLVFLDERSLAPRAVSPPLLGLVAEIHDLVLSDLDGDGDDEIVIAGGDPSRPYFRIYDVGAGFALTQIGGAFSTSGMSFRAIEVADADGNGRPEVLVCSGGESTGSQGNRVYAFEPATGAELRHSAALGSTIDFLETIVVGDIDLDGVQEVAALLHGGQVGIFTGTTLATEAILPGTFTSLALVKHGLLVGDTDGVLRRVAYDGVGFTTVSSRDLGDRAITGIVPRPHGTLLVASDGFLTLYGSGTAKRVWHTDDYGRARGGEFSRSCRARRWSRAGSAACSPSWSGSGAEVRRGRLPIPVAAPAR